MALECLSPPGLGCGLGDGVGNKGGRCVPGCGELGGQFQGEEDEQDDKGDPGYSGEGLLGLHGGLLSKRELGGFAPVEKG